MPTVKVALNGPYILACVAMATDIVGCTVDVVVVIDNFELLNFIHIASTDRAATLRVGLWVQAGWKAAQA
jgi:hypothetical protein